LADFLLNIEILEQLLQLLK